MKSEKFNYKWPCKTCEFENLPPTSRVCCDCAEDDFLMYKRKDGKKTTRVAKIAMKIKIWVWNNFFPYRVIALVQAGEDPEIELEWKMTCLVSASRRIYDIQRTHIANSLKGIGIYSIKKNAMISWTMGEKK